mmetsp:Transcript_23971/g.47926  ORF Transcript_23971/g.47926 Transcript_23971/m.47926 type:complete len:715 (-) Transcript_23971:406-2550(-)
MPNRAKTDVLTQPPFVVQGYAYPLYDEKTGELVVEAEARGLWINKAGTRTWWCPATGVSVADPKLLHRDARRCVRGHTRPVLAGTVLEQGPFQGCYLSGSADKSMIMWGWRGPHDPVEGLHNPARAEAPKPMDPKATRPKAKDKGVADWPRRLRQFDAHDGEPESVGHKDYISTIAALPDGRKFLSGSYDRNIILWNLVDEETEDGKPKPFTTAGSLMRVFTDGHKDIVSALAVFADGSKFLSASNDSTIVLWSLADVGAANVRWTSAGALLQRFPENQKKDMGHTHFVVGLVALPDGKKFLSASSDKTIKLWSIASGTAVCTFGGHNGAVTCIAPMPPGVMHMHGRGGVPGVESSTSTSTSFFVGARFLSGSADKSIILHTPDLLEEDEHEVLLNPSWIKTGLGSNSTSNEASVKHTTQVHNKHGETIMLRYQGHTGEVNSVTVLADAHQFLSASDDKTIVLWHTEGNRLATFRCPVHSSLVMALPLAAEEGKALDSTPAYRFVSAYDTTIHVTNINAAIAKHQADANAALIAAGRSDELQKSLKRLEAKARRLPPNFLESVVDNFSISHNLGLKWKRVALDWEEDRPKGVELENVKLANALVSQSTFSPAEWASFGITGLRADHYIESRSKDEIAFFRPGPAGYDTSAWQDDRYKLLFSELQATKQEPDDDHWMGRLKTLFPPAWQDASEWTKVVDFLNVKNSKVMEFLNGK